MTTLRIADSIAFELRLLGLVGVFEYDKYNISFLASAQFVLFMLLMGIQQTFTLLYLETIEQLTDLLYVLGIYIMVCAKLAGLVRKRDKVAGMIDTLNDELMVPTDWKELYHSEFVKALRHLRLASRSYLCVIYLAIIALIVTSVLNHKLMFVCYFPFETRYEYSLQGYWIAFSYQVIYSIYLVQTNINVDILTSSLLHCAAVKLKVLRYECEKLCSFYKCVDNLNAIKTAVAFHNDTVRYVADIENVFSFGLFVQCGISVLSICVILLKAIFLDIFNEPEQLLGAITALMAFVNEIFYYCHYGNQIQYQSTKLFTSIYLCEWYNLNCTCSHRGGRPNRNHLSAIRRSILIFLERTKRPTIVTAGRFIKLTYESYITICRTGYQYFAVFRDALK